MRRDDAALAEALEAFETARPRGESPDVRAFCARYPQVSPRVLEMHVRLEDLGREPEPPETFAAPEQVGGYTLLEEIGRGGMGRVFRALDPKLGREIALKLLASDPGRASGRRDRFLREARALARIDHPNVVPIHDVGEDGPHSYLAMELMAGSLATQTRRGDEAGDEADRLRQVVAWTLEAARGLEAAHAAGILHRDVKPGNLLLGRDGHVRVGDFGLARLEGEDSLTASQQVVGTLRYAAPEQLRGGVEATARSDVYGLGATLYHLALREPPGEGSLSKLPRRLRAIVTRAMAYEPEARYADTASLADDLCALLAWRRPWAAASRRRHRAVLGAVAALAAATMLTPGPAPEVVAGASRMWCGSQDRFEHGDEPLPVVLRGRYAWDDLVAGPGASPVLFTEVNGRRYRVALEPSSGAAVLSLGEEGGPRTGELVLETADRDVAVAWSLRGPLRDLDGDGLPDVAVTGVSWRGTNVTLVKWEPQAWRQPALGFRIDADHQFDIGSVAVEDWDGDGRLEILAGDSGANRQTSYHEGRPLLHEVDFATGTTKRRWPLEGIVRSTPQFLRDASGKVQETYLDVDALGGELPRLYRFAPRSGEAPRVIELPGAGGGSLTWPVFQDVDGDGDPEVLIGHLDGSLHCLRRGAPSPPLWSFDAGGNLVSYLLETQQDDDPLPELCFSSVGRFSCIKTAAGLAARDRVVWSAELPDGDYSVNLPTDVGDLDGDGFSEIAIGTFSGGKVYVLTKNDPSHVLLTVDVPPEARPTGRPLGETKPWFFVGRLAALPAPDGGLELVGALFDGWVLAWRIEGRSAELSWSFPMHGTVTASPQVVPLRALPGTAGTAGTHGVLVASNNRWLDLLVPRRDGSGEVDVVWSFHTEGDIGGTPSVVEEGETQWVVFTTRAGSIYKVPILPRSRP